MMPKQTLENHEFRKNWYSPSLKVSGETGDSRDSKLSSEKPVSGLPQSLPTIKQKVNSCKKLYVFLTLHQKNNKLFLQTVLEPHQIECHNYAYQL